MRRPVHARQAGFALVAVIWGLGLAALLGSAVIIGARYRARDIERLTEIAQASTDAESAVLFGLRKILDGDPLYLQRRAVACTLPDGAVAGLLITAERGKIDLNAAPPDLLARFFVALTGDPRRGADLAEALAAFRGKPKTEGQSHPVADKPEAAKQAPLSSVLELDRLPGMSTALLYHALPFVTIASGKPEFDPQLAPPDLLALLGLPPDPGTGIPQRITGALTLHATVVTPGGTWAVRDALVELGEKGAFTIREWRIGQRGSDGSDALERSAQACLL